MAKNKKKIVNINYDPMSGIKTFELPPQEEIKFPKMRLVRCIWHTSVSATCAETGNRYTFRAFETKIIPIEDARDLLARRTPPRPICCGGKVQSPQRVFV